MLIKRNFVRGSFVREVSYDEITSKLASKNILDKLEKHARHVRSLAPRSEDFLYFSIIFLKSAEASIIDLSGNPKTLDNGEKAWGYFDDSWKWHGNVRPHKNNNGDIFPESQLRTATKQWIGMPLCVDHKSDTVDGVRGIILDTYYDDVLKQVVGMCALDKINYPDLARKVSTGVVRYGSMGTGVEISVCTDCGNKAFTQHDYCKCIIERRAWGEINVGLKPIEYSLVVQPAEPGAILLRCIASIKDHSGLLTNNGVESVDDLVSSMKQNEVKDLERLLTNVDLKSSNNSKNKIVRAYLSSHNLLKTAHTEKTVGQDIESNFARAMMDLSRSSGFTLQDAIGGNSIARELYSPLFVEYERALPFEDPLPAKDEESQMLHHDDNGVMDYSGTSGGIIASPSEPTNPDEPFSNADGSFGLEGYASENNKSLKSIIGEIMKNSKLSARSRMRRKNAYYQGGTDGAAEPSDFNNEYAQYKKIRESDKHLVGRNELGSPEGLPPADKALKERIQRANDRAVSNKRVAYLQGGSGDSPEPNTYVSEDYMKYWMQDRQMIDGNMGGTTGMFPGDEAIKSNLKRASYRGPALSTKFLVARKKDGTINKGASKFEVYAGSKLVIATTAKNIWGKNLNKEWGYLRSQEYGKAVVAEIRESGVPFVASILTKKAQEIPEMPLEPAMPEMGEEDLGLDMEPEAMEDPMDLGAPDDFGAPDGAEAAEDLSSKERVEKAFMEMEESMEEIRSAIDLIADNEDVDININLGKDIGGADVSSEGDDSDLMSLSSTISKNLRKVLAESNSSADELALLTHSYNNITRLSSSQRRSLRDITKSAMHDSALIIGEASSLINLSKTASKLVSDKPVIVKESKRTHRKSTSKNRRGSSLVSNTLKLRASKRASLVSSFKKRAEEEDDIEGLTDEQREEVEKIVAEVMEEVADESSDERVFDHEEDLHDGEHSEDEKEDEPESEAKDCAMHDNSSTPTGELNPCSKADDEAAEALGELKARLNSSFEVKRAGEEISSFRVRVRRAYDLGMMMQAKGFIGTSRAALENQVDEVLLFDDKAFESFKRSVANARTNLKVSTASDLGGVNVGIASESPTVVVTRKSLSDIWDN